ncbi:MAG: hypothetical protein QW162_05690 [Ignisphaera sp.]
MEDLVKVILSFGYTIILLALFSVFLSGGEVLYTPLITLLLFSIAVGIIMIILALLIAKGKIGFLFVKGSTEEEQS